MWTIFVFLFILLLVLGAIAQAKHQKPKRTRRATPRETTAPLVPSNAQRYVRRTSPRKNTRGILDLPIADTPLAVIDFETTGLSAGIDRVVEVSIVRIEPGRAPVLALDTLVHPDRRVTATEIHGITDADVADAPRFIDIADTVAHALADCVVSSYNMYFDIKFLDYELRQAGLAAMLPYLCLMYLRPLLGLGKRCSLDDACRAHKITYTAAHVAAADALAAAQLWGIYIDAMADRRVHSFGDLAQLKSYKFIESFAYDPLPPPVTRTLRCTGPLKSRWQAETISTAPQRDAIHEYWDVLTTVLSDLVVTDEEIDYLGAERRELRLSPEAMRSAHARAFANLMTQSIEDTLLDDQECQRLHHLHRCLSRLGWAPGE